MRESHSTDTGFVRQSAASAYAHADADDDGRTWLVNPFLFMNVLLVEPDAIDGAYKPVGGNSLLGSTVSSLHRLKDINNKGGSAQTSLHGVH